MPFGRYLRETRENRAITLTEWARRLEVLTPYLPRDERENPPWDRVLAVAAEGRDAPRDQLFPPELRTRTGDAAASYRAQRARGAR